MGGSHIKKIRLKKTNSDFFYQQGHGHEPNERVLIQISMVLFIHCFLYTAFSNGNHSLFHHDTQLY